MIVFRKQTARVQSLGTNLGSVRKWFNDTTMRSMYPCLNTLTGACELVIGGDKDTFALTLAGGVSLFAERTDMNPLTSSPVGCGTNVGKVGSRKLERFMTFRTTTFDRDTNLTHAKLYRCPINQRLVLTGYNVIENNVFGNATLVHREGNNTSDFLHIKGGNTLKSYIAFNPVYLADGYIQADSVFIMYNNPKIKTYPNVETIFKDSKSIIVSFQSMTDAREFIDMNNKSSCAGIVTGFSKAHPVLVVFGKANLSHFADLLADNKDLDASLFVRESGAEAFNRFCRFTQLCPMMPSDNPKIIAIP